MAQKTWELANNIELVDEIYKYNAGEQSNIQAAKPWEKNPHFFKDIKISALALLKMNMHARSGGNLEVMGMLLGKVDANTMIVMDSFALPVEGTETRVNAQDQAYEYMAAYTESAKQIGRKENVIGWYHSHPGTILIHITFLYFICYLIYTICNKHRMFIIQLWLSYTHTHKLL